jgi:hypothetical protein
VALFFPLGMVVSAHSVQFQGSHREITRNRPGNAEDGSPERWKELGLSQVFNQPGTMSPPNSLLCEITGSLIL